MLDDLITAQEVMTQVKKLNSNKACGPDGIPPGIFNVLPPNWLLTLSGSFSNIFMTSTYPLSWVTAKLFPVYKRGFRSVVSNYILTALRSFMI